MAKSGGRVPGHRSSRMALYQQFEEVQEHMDALEDIAESGVYGRLPPMLRNRWSWTTQKLLTNSPLRTSQPSQFLLSRPGSSIHTGRCPAGCLTRSDRRNRAEIDQVRNEIAGR